MGLKSYTIWKLIADICADSQIYKQEVVVKKYRPIVHLMISANVQKSIASSVKQEKDLPVFSIEAVANDFSLAFNITREELIGRSRKKEIVSIRHIFRYICFALNVDSLVKIAKFMNNDHTTIIHSRRLVSNYLEIEDREFVELWNKYMALGNPKYTKYFLKHQQPIDLNAEQASEEEEKKSE